MSVNPSKISQNPYNRRFNSWAQALQSFIDYANKSEVQINNNFSAKIDIKAKQTSRSPSLRLRFQVLRRDNFTCCQCGASPAKDSSVELHVDHIKAWSNGGETVRENLQTLCLKCNLGKSNLE